MKAISLWQPWATLCVIGAKRFETRSWPTSYRGPLAIHASSKWTNAQANLCGRRPFVDALNESGGMPLGAFVGVVDLVDCLETSIDVESLGIRYHPWVLNLSDRERAFGDFSWDRYGWKLANPRVLDRPLDARGQQRLWTVPPDLERQILDRLRGSSSSPPTAGSSAGAASRSATT